MKTLVAVTTLIGPLFFAGCGEDESAQNRHNHDRHKAIKDAVATDPAVVHATDENVLNRVQTCANGGGQQLDLAGSSITGMPGKLTALPSEIGDLTNLKRLVVWGTELDTLPPEISKLVELEELVIADNRLTGLPPEVGELKRLKYLDVSGNELTALPPELGNLTELTNLMIDANPIKKVDLDQLKALKNLKDLKIPLTGGVTPEELAAFKRALPNCRVH